MGKKKKEPREGGDRNVCTKEIAILKNAMKETQNPRMFERYLAVRLHLEGLTLSEITRIIDRSFPTISGYWNSYRKRA